MSKERKKGLLTQKQATGPKGCGAGTENACFALTEGPGGLQCSMITNPPLASVAGIQLGWRVNIDESDKKAWCPFEVLNNSKKEMSL